MCPASPAADSSSVNQRKNSNDGTDRRDESSRLIELPVSGRLRNSLRSIPPPGIVHIPPAEIGTCVRCAYWALFAMAIEAVVFDWGGVLAGAVGADLGEVERRLGVPTGSLPALMGMHPCDTDTENLWHMRELGRATSLEWAHWYSARLRSVGGVPLFTPEEMVATEGGRFKVSQNTVVLDAVRQLRLAGYKLAICTNNFREIGEVWREGLPLELFDAVVVSCEIGLRKPDAEMFDYVTDRLGVGPASVVLVDDFEGNVDGARRAGWHGILVGPNHAAAMTALGDLLAEHPSDTHP